MNGIRTLAFGVGASCCLFSIWAFRLGVQGLGLLPGGGPDLGWPKDASWMCAADRSGNIGA